MSFGQLKVNAIRLVGGLAVLDFLNTCDGRRPGTSLKQVVDKLSDMKDLVHWYLHAGLIDLSAHDHYLVLIRRATWQPADGFARIIDFRETLYQLLLPVALGQAIETDKLQALSYQLEVTTSRRMLVNTSRGVVWRWRRGDTINEMVNSLIGQVAIQAADLLTSPELSRLKVCATPNCDWLFLDTSKNGGRRWCQMRVCGSREKSRRARI
jgi:predicted RNA-binding Zn ribbon-like protein